MNKIISKEYFSDKVVKLVVEAPLIAKSRRAGHFVIVRCGEHGERIPLTIAQADVEKGTITLVVSVWAFQLKKYVRLSGRFFNRCRGAIGASHANPKLWNCSVLRRRRWCRSPASYSYRI